VREAEWRFLLDENVSRTVEHERHGRGYTVKHVVDVPNPGAGDLPDNLPYAQNSGSTRVSYHNTETSLALFDLVDLVSGEAVRLLMDFLTCFFAGAFEQTEDSAFVLVDPVVQVFHAVVALGFDVFLVSFHDLLDACVHVPVDVHIQWHSAYCTMSLEINGALAYEGVYCSVDHARTDMSPISINAVS
jgi:hypothetical protein